MYCKDKLENGLEEMQFEELRAMRWLENKKEIGKFKIVSPIVSFSRR